MRVYRIARQRYASDLSGTGARLYGGRWNPKGIALVYTAESRALAAMELAVRIDLNDLPEDLCVITLDVPDTVTVEGVEQVDQWDRHPPDPLASVLQGQRFVERGDALVLRVPSVVVRGDINYLLNPLHEDFQQVHRVETVPFFFDERLSHG